jgi:hypothetical protein
MDRLCAGVAGTGRSCAGPARIARVMRHTRRPIMETQRQLIKIRF